MNWTEGSLARHSRRKGWNDEAARQKKYFAKQRARLQNPSHPKPTVGVASFVPSYIPQSPRNSNETSSSTTPRHREPRKRLIHVSSENGSDKTASPSSQLSRSSGGRPGETATDRHEDLETKRRRLLDKNDWTGIEFQKPLFPGASEHGPSTSRIATPLQTRGKNHIMESVPRYDQHARDGYMAPPRMDNRITIRVGSQDFRWSEKSNSVRGQPQNGSLPSLQDWMSQRETSSPLAPSCYISDETTASTKELSRPKHRKPEKQKQRSSRSNRDRRPNGRTLSRLLQWGASDEAQNIIISSPRRIHHPRPARIGNLRLLGVQPPSPEPSESVVAQVGATPYVRQSLENIGWMDWLKLPGEKEQLDRSRITGMEAPRTISPGISQRWEQSEAESSSMAETLNQDPSLSELSTQHTSSILQEPELPRLPPLSSPFASSEHDADHYPHRTETENRNSLDLQMNGQTSVPNNLVLPVQPELTRPPNVRDLMDLLSEEEELGRECPAIEPDIEAEDDDEVWKKFVLDDDCVEISRRAREEAQEQTKRLLRQPPVSSNAAEPPLTARMNTTSPVTENGDLPREHPRQDGTVSCTPHSHLKEVTSSSSVVAQPASPSSRAQQPEFRFHQPRLFVGRLASAQTPAMSAPSWDRPVTSGRGRRRVSGAGRRRQRGRPDIRALPNFEGDPIEESP